MENAPSSGGAAGGVKACCQAKAECLVCKYNNDLACVDVTVDAATPRATVGGKEYFFCSESCKKEFERSPGKFATAK